jgi:hypothetical protein
MCTISTFKNKKGNNMKHHLISSLLFSLALTTIVICNSTTINGQDTTNDWNDLSNEIFNTTNDWDYNDTTTDDGATTDEDTINDQNEISHRNKQAIFNPFMIRSWNEYQSIFRKDGKVIGIHYKNFPSTHPTIKKIRVHNDDINTNITAEFHIVNNQIDSKYIISENGSQETMKLDKITEQDRADVQDWINFN